jgi:hypothetical protein
MDYHTSERRMLEAEARYISDLALTHGPDLNPDIMGVLSGMFRSGWRDCWAAGILERLNERRNEAADDYDCPTEWFEDEDCPTELEHTNREDYDAV